MSCEAVGSASARIESRSARPPVWSGDEFERAVDLLLAQIEAAVGRRGLRGVGAVGLEAGHVDRVDGVAEEVRGVGERAQQVVAVGHVAGEHRPVGIVDGVVGGRIGPAAGEEEHHLAARRRGEAAQRAHRRGDHPAHLLADVLGIGELLEIELAGEGGAGARADALADALGGLEVAQLGETLEAVGRAADGLLVGAAQGALGIRPGRPASRRRGRRRPRWPCGRPARAGRAGP